MKVIAKYKDYSFDKEGNIELTFTIDSRFIEQVVELEQTHKDKYFELVTRDKIAQKTERQNNAVWQVVTEISKKINGRANEENKNEVYCQSLVMASLDPIILQMVYFDEEETKIINKGLKDSEGKWIKKPKLTPLQTLEKTYRVVKVHDIRENDKGKSAIAYCYKGLSLLDKREVNDLLEELLDWGSKLGLDSMLESDYLRSLVK